ncbi:MAG: pyrroline-5-carboxylate reductase [Chloroflexi bacterium]|nr:pyrroline-5-carboxylate reductase [Chloroflexota bacterium]
MALQCQARVALIGGGTMAEAIIGGLLRQGTYRPQDILVGEPLAERRRYLAEAYGIRAIESNPQAIAESMADQGMLIVLLAVKPQVLGQVLEGLAGAVPKEALVLSIVAGAQIEMIRQKLGTPAVVRIMPNTPGQIGEGISVWTATPAVTPVQREAAREILSALGQEIYVEDEHYLDMATALSGSGPAYVFLFIEALIDAGVRMGFARTVAEKLALQTVRGAAIYAQQTGLHPAELRNRVTSPGGTTAEALHELEKGGLRATVANAVWAAYAKARSLGEKKP